MPWMYILECEDGFLYTGSTWDLESRVNLHFQRKAANFTQRHQVIRLLHCEYFTRIKEAFEREKQVQNWSRSKKKALAESNCLDLKNLSKKTFKKNSFPTIPSIQFACGESLGDRKGDYLKSYPEN